LRLIDRNESIAAHENGELQKISKCRTAGNRETREAEIRREKQYGRKKE